MNNSQILHEILKFMQARRQLSVATYGDNPWIATLYYSCDENLNLYVLTDPQTIHAQHIAKNPKVAVAIADSPQNPANKKSGVQLWGIANQIKGKSKIIHAINLWRETLEVTSPAYSYAGMVKKLINGKMYVIQPKQIKLFNEELWEEGKEKVITLG